MANWVSTQTPSTQAAEIRSGMKRNASTHTSTRGCRMR